MKTTAVPLHLLSQPAVENDSLMALVWLGAGAAVMALLAVGTAWEAALQRVNRISILLLAERGINTAPFDRWIANPVRYVRTLLILSTLLQCAFVILVVLWLRDCKPDMDPLHRYTAAAALSAALLLIFGKVLPRNWGRAHSDRLVPVAVPVLESIAWVLAPVLLLLELLVRIFLRLLRTEPAPEIAGMTEDEVRLFVEVSQKEGVLERDEGEMMASIVDFRDTMVKEIMTPRTDFESIHKDADLQQAIELVVRSGHSRLPVYTDSLDQIDGILYAKDLFRWVHRQAGDTPFRVADVMRPAIFVPETKNVNELLRFLQTKRTHLAIVVDEYGGTAGLVTIEDILEEIVGDIQDEYDAEEPLYTIEEDGSILADAKIDIEQLADDLDIALPPADDEMDYETLGGFLCAHLGSVPVVGQAYRHNGYEITVVDADERKVKQVRIVRLSPDHENSNREPS